jgi:hypothetical protein
MEWLKVKALSSSLNTEKKKKKKKGKFSTLHSDRKPKSQRAQSPFYYFPKASHLKMHFTTPLKEGTPELTTTPV